MNLFGPTTTISVELYHRQEGFLAANWRMAFLGRHRLKESG